MLQVKRTQGGLAFLTLPSGKVACVFHCNDHTPDRLVNKNQIHDWSDAKKLPPLFRNGAEYSIKEEGDDYFIIQIDNVTLRYTFNYPNKHWEYAKTKLDMPKVSFSRTNHLVQILYLVDDTTQEEADVIASSQSHFVCS
jgi:hypothetical protein